MICWIKVLISSLSFMGRSRGGGGGGGQGSVPLPLPWKIIAIGSLRNSGTETTLLEGGPYGPLYNMLMTKLQTNKKTLSGPPPRRNFLDPCIHTISLLFLLFSPKGKHLSDYYRWLRWDFNKDSWEPSGMPYI